MSALVSTDPKETLEAMKAELDGDPPDPTKFDPLLQVNHYVWARGMQLMGLEVMNVDQTPGAPNDGHVCPLCESRAAFDAHLRGECKDPNCRVPPVKPDDKPWDEVMLFDQCLDQMRAYCLENGLIAKPS